MNFYTPPRSQPKSPNFSNTVGKLGTQSMYPEFHARVLAHFSDSKPPPVFHPWDSDEGCIEYHDTSIMGRFRCRNRECAKRGWGSKHVGIFIRQYRNHRYNAVVYHQHCQDCDKLGEFFIDEDSYVDRVAYRLKVWAGLSPERPPYNEGQTKDPHVEELCEGCLADHCMRA